MITRKLRRYAEFCLAPIDPTVKDLARRMFYDGANYVLGHLWTSVEEDLPSYEDDVLVYDTWYKGMYFSHRTNDPDIIVDNNQFATFCKSQRITHWMKIEKPKKKK